MSLWSNTGAAGAPKFKIIATNAANGQAMYANTTSGAFKPNEVDTVVNITAAISASTHRTAGWSILRYGTGQVVNVTVTTIGAAYANATDYVTFTSTSNTSVMATANLVTFANGSVSGFTNLVSTSGFTNTASLTTVITTVAGTGPAVVVPVLGGRAGRVSAESLVAMGSTS